MKGHTERARELLPAIVITVLSMIQALALELYWGRIREADLSGLDGWGLGIHWLQLTVMFLGMLQIWLMYVSLMLRFSWVPSMEDTLTPFAIGLMEFSLIDLMGRQYLGPWFIILASVFALSVCANHAAFKRARKDPENVHYFSQVEEASWRDYSISIAAIVALGLFGLILWIMQGHTVVALVGLVFAGSALLHQLFETHRRWALSLEPVRQ